MPVADDTEPVTRAEVADAAPEASARPVLIVEMPEIPPPAAPDRSGWIASLAAALLLHSAVMVIVDWRRPYYDIGNHGTDLDAISVEMVSATAIDAIATTAREMPAAMKEPIAIEDGSQTLQTAVPEQADSKPDTKPAQLPAKAADLVIPDMIVKPEPAQPSTPTIVIAAVKPETTEPVIDSNDTEAPNPPQQAPAPTAATASSATEPQPAQTLGGASAIAESPVAIAARSAAIARAGEMSAYGAKVHKVMVQNPPQLPRGTRATGKVRIEFALLPDGSVAYARILSSSSNNMLDRIALDSIRTAKFERPPASLQPEDLKFNMPIQFR